MKRLISLSIFFVVAGISWWSTMDFLDDSGPAQSAQGGHFIELFMNEFEMTAMNEKGEPAYIFNGKHLKKYSDSDDTTVTQPIVFLLNTDKQWKISAELATVNDEKDTVLLTDNVLMQQQDIEPSITIRTQRLLIHTKSQIAQTKAPVDITQGNSRVTSIGMIYNNKNSELELSSNVSGYYSANE